jgi:hypothetical protein
LTEGEAVVGTTLCRDKPDVKFSGTAIIKKKEKESGMTAANRWLTEQADGWCESGLCSDGKCRGVLSNVVVQLLQDHDADCEIKFAADIACECKPTISPQH